MQKFGCQNLDNLFSRLFPKFQTAGMCGLQIIRSGRAQEGGKLEGLQISKIFHLMQKLIVAYYFRLIMCKKMLSR